MGRGAFPQDGLVRKSIELLGIEEPIVRVAIDHEIANGRLVRDRIGDEECIYLAALHRAETQLATRIQRLQQGRHPLPKIDIEKALAWVEQQVGLSLAPAQRDAIDLAARHKVLVM